MYIHYSEAIFISMQKKNDFCFRARSVASGLFLNRPILQYRTLLYLLQRPLLEVDFFETVNDTVCSELPM